ncbi:MAG TPA: prepilin-type N-terminal cleavage/methylation domain-containing protein [Fimbriimonadaceae bacterium]|nr:prepilin-type N-terminal cleavage/methylation domain-containing protein [Fimbriimonadaceae bacterium]
MTRKTGFTLIELLVVIAIIAILAAIIFPVYMRTKDSAYRAGDISNLNSIRTALQLYRADQEAYPPQILGYASLYMSGPEMGQVMPANQLRAALYPRRIASLDTMRPAYDRSNSSVTTPAVWPDADPRAVGTAAILDLNGDGILDNATDDIAGARQAWGPDKWFCSQAYLDSVNTPGSVTCDGPSYSTDMTKAAPFYAISGYDVANVEYPNSNTGAADHRWEIHYALRWSSFALTTGNREDDPRQLIYNDPPESTVVTWDSWFRDYDAGGNVQREKRDIVLFLDGGARPYDSVDLSQRSWRVMP